MPSIKDRPSTYPATRVASYGILGGLVGAIVMGLIALMIPIPGTRGAPFFVAAAMKMGMGPMATTVGWGLHLITGLAVGAIFGLAVAKASVLRLRTAQRAAGLGAVAGLAVWLVFFMPMMVMLMPALTSMPMMVVGSFVAHMIFGLVLGAVTWVAVPKGSPGLKCQACGETFGTPEALQQHEKAHTSKSETSAGPSALHEPKCDACGMTFQSEKELADHVRQAHPMPASHPISAAERMPRKIEERESI